ncbi:MAG: hypothetical protein ABIS47_00170, partial [Acidimicrobiales bacterium]
LGLVALATVLAGPASANHDDKELEVVVALNAAGSDRISVRDATFDSTSFTTLASEVAIALGRPPGSFRASEDLRGGAIHPDAKLAQPDERGGLSYALDTGQLQVLGQRDGYDAIILVLCTPRVHQVVDALVAPQEAPYAKPGSRCRGWYQPIDEPAIRAVVQLLPDRQRYPGAVTTVAGAAAIAFGLLGLGATLLRRGPLKRRSLASWLLSLGAALVVFPAGWSAVSIALWVRGPAADPMLLGGGSDGEQVVRTLFPGLAFLLPALLPAVILLSAPRRPRPPPPAPGAPAAPPLPTWWPVDWWRHWAGQAHRS